MSKEIKDELVQAGFMIETILGYLEAGCVKEGKEHLEVLNRQLMKLAGVAKAD